MKAALAADRTALGYLVTVPAVAAVQALAGSGADFVIIDLEHAPIGIETASMMIAATKGSRTAPLVRVPALDSDLVAPALDSGAFGILFPQIAAGAAAKAAVLSSRYPPNGTRGYGPGYAALRWDLAPEAYVAAANQALLVVVLVESPEGVAALDDILAVDGIDVVAVARSDLAASLGLSGRFDHPRVQQLVAAAEEKILRRAGPKLGGIAFSPEEAKAMIGAGYRFLVLGTDARLLRGTAAAQLAAIRGT